MKLSDFDYNLPKELIAQNPLPERDMSRLLVLDKASGAIDHRRFSDIVDLLKKDDLLVLNDTKVFKARLLGKREGLTGKVDVLLADKIDDYTYCALCRPAAKLKDGTMLVFADSKLKAQVIRREGDFKLIRFLGDNNFQNIIDDIGKIPLPPYIKRDAIKEDEERYQTVYAKARGAIAAPTAGLHFTEALIEKIDARGVDMAYLTLHVGYATFKPVKEEDITRHKMHKEYYSISEETAEKVDSAKANGRRIVAVGTTTLRALESSALKRTTKDTTDLFIYPGFKFKITDALITNFHLPRTTLLMLVCAFAGRENIMKAYNEAIRMRYRFYSYGDAMLIQ